MELSAVERLATELLSRHGLVAKGWSFGWDRAVRRAGACHYTRKRITISRKFAEQFPEPEVRETILHEIAHALVGRRHGHDAVWRQKAREIRSLGERTHCFEFVQAPWALRCRNRCFSAPRHRRMSPERLRLLRCARCGSTLETVEASSD